MILRNTFERGLKATLMLGSSALVLQALGAPLPLTKENGVSSWLGATAASAQMTAAEST